MYMYNNIIISTTLAGKIDMRKWRTEADSLIDMLRGPNVWSHRGREDSVWKGVVQGVQQLVSHFYGNEKWYSHWVTISTIGCCLTVVDIFDSGPKRFAAKTDCSLTLY